MMSNKSTEADFAAALADPECIGFTFGGAGGKGHGAYSLTPGSTFRLIAFEVLP